MCARRFLTAIFVLTLLVVGASLAIYQWGGNVLLSQAIPKGHFQPTTADQAPDYADAASWIARPDIRDNPALWRPPDVSDVAVRGSAAIFFVHPTTYLEKDRWNAPLNDQQSRSRAELFIRSQASAFANVGDVWAPRYRQAAFGAFLLDSEDARLALGLAYSDVLRAFDRFVAEHGSDKPIILAGHSQGSLHLTRLMRERIAGKPLARRIVAAYVVGWPLSARADLPAIGLAQCRGAEDTGCVLSWQSFKEPANTSLVTDFYDHSLGPTGIERRREDMVCTNPITGIAGGTAPPPANAGTLIPTADMSSATLKAGLVGAKCDRGFLKIDGLIPPLGPYVLLGNNYHVYDYALFWGSIRRDALTRADSFWRKTR